MAQKTITEYLFDRGLLLIAGVFGLVGLMGATYLLDDRLGIPRPWMIFIYFSLLYIAMVTGFSVSQIRRMKKKWAGVVLLALLQILIVGSAFLLFYFDVITIPERGFLPWAQLIGLVATTTVIAFPLLLRRLGLRRGARNERRHGLF